MLLGEAERTGGATVLCCELYRDNLKLGQDAAPPRNHIIHHG
jgi:hypothetical protein